MTRVSKAGTECWWPRRSAVRGHLLEMSGDPAASGYDTAARYVTNVAEKRYLSRQGRRRR